MLYSLLAAGLLLGLDSFVVSLSAGTLDPSLSRRRRLALCFGLCDGLASYLGMTELAKSALLPATQWLGPAAVVGYGLYLLALAGFASREEVRRAAWLTYALPACLSLDNLVAAAAPSLSGTEAILAAALIGVLSGGLSLVGTFLGCALARRRSARLGWLSGALIVLAGACLCWREINF